MTNENIDFLERMFMTRLTLWLDCKAFVLNSQLHRRVSKFKFDQDLRMLNPREFPVHYKIITEGMTRRNFARLIKAGLSVEDFQRPRRAFSEFSEALESGKKRVNLWGSTNEPITILTTEGEAPKVQIIGAGFAEVPEGRIYVSNVNFVPRSDA
jgi:hypothetical protein